LTTLVPSVLACRFAETNPGSFQVLREHEDKQLAMRRPHAVHRRVLQAHLTGSGQQTLRAGRQAVDAVEARMLAHLPETRQRQLACTLRQCVEALTVSGD
jgi:DNA-binding MarR family transcriptional regulator